MLLALLARISWAMSSSPVVDCALDRIEALGPGISSDLAAKLEVIQVGYIGFDHQRHAGQVVCHREVCPDLVELFQRLEKAGFPLRLVCPISLFGGSDSVSMAADNTYCFANRGIWGSREPSWHAQGRAIDLNPRENPAFKRGKTVPADGKLVPGSPGTLSDTALAVRTLRARGWQWGAHWRRVQDWQHFQKVRSTPSP